MGALSMLQPITNGFGLQWTCLQPPLFQWTCWWWMRWILWPWWLWRWTCCVLVLPCPSWSQQFMSLHLLLLHHSSQAIHWSSGHSSERGGCSGRSLICQGGIPSSYRPQEEVPPQCLLSSLEEAADASIREWNTTSIMSSNVMVLAKQWFWGKQKGENEQLVCLGGDVNTINQHFSVQA